MAGVAVGGFLIVRAVTDDDDRSAGADSSESSSPSDSDSDSEEPTDVPSETDATEVDPTSVGEPTPIAAACETGSPSDGKRPGAVLRGGGLRAPAPAGFKAMGLDQAFTFADKVASVGREVEPTWVATYALGGLDRSTGYTSLEQAAETVLTCMIESQNFYKRVESRTDQGSTAITVDGHDAWRITAEVRVDDPKVSVEGDVATVIVVDTEDASTYGLFASVVPIGDAALIGEQEAVAGALEAR